MLFDGTFTVYIYWSYHQLYGHLLLLEFKLHICTRLQVDVTSTRDYYKTIWILTNGTHIIYLFNIYWWYASQSNKTISSSDVAIITCVYILWETLVLQSTSVIMPVSFVWLFSSYCITCTTHVCHVVCYCMLLYIVTLYVIWGYSCSNSYNVQLKPQSAGLRHKSIILDIALPWSNIYCFAATHFAAPFYCIV